MSADKFNKQQCIITDNLMFGLVLAVCNFNWLGRNFFFLASRGHPQWHNKGGKWGQRRSWT